MQPKSTECMTNELIGATQTNTTLCVCGCEGDGGRQMGHLGVTGKPRGVS